MIIKTLTLLEDPHPAMGESRISLENLGMNGLGFSEIDRDAEITYREFFGDK